MNNLTIAVIAIAVAQALTILLTIGRDREIKKLRELVTQQGLLISEIKGWLLRERIELVQPRRMKPDREPTREAPEIKVPEIKAPEIVPEIKAPEIVFGSKAPEKSKYLKLTHLRSYLKTTLLKSKCLKLECPSNR